MVRIYAERLMLMGAEMKMAERRDKNTTQGVKRFNAHPHQGERVKVKDAAEALGVSSQFVRIGLQRKTLPIGTAVKMSSKWTYHISPELLAEYLGK